MPKNTFYTLPNNVMLNRVGVSQYHIEALCQAKDNEESIPLKKIEFDALGYLSYYQVMNLVSTFKTAY